MTNTAHPFPIIMNVNQKPLNGLLVETPAFCSRANPEACKAHYSAVSSKVGPHQCPYGFSTYVSIANGEKFIFTAMNITGFVDRKSTKTRINGEFFPRMSLEQCENILLKWHNDRVRDEAELRAHHNIDTSAESAKAFNKALLHEIRPLNAQIKSQVEAAIEKNSKSQEGLEFLLKNIFATSSLISVRMDACDLTINPEIALTGRRKILGVHQKFLKAVRVLDVLCRTKNIRIEIKGVSHSTISAYTFFDILPYLLIENAIKFSPHDQTIVVEFLEKNKKLVTIVSSFGPALCPGEEAQVCESGFRGKNAAVAKDGSGLGLFVAKQIAKYHEIDLGVHSATDRTTTINGIPYCEFTVTLTCQAINDPSWV